MRYKALVLASILLATAAYGKEPKAYKVASWFKWMR
jgi:hypothetical protein